MTNHPPNFLPFDCRAVWLADMGYVVKAGTSLNYKLDYKKAIEWVKDHHKGPAKGFLFNGYDDAYGIPDGLSGFYQAMEREGFGVCLHKMRYGLQKAVDVDLASHLLGIASTSRVEPSALERIYLTTGDRDFIPAVHMARALFPEVEISLLVYRNDNSVSYDLMTAVEGGYYIQDQNLRR